MPKETSTQRKRRLAKAKVKRQQRLANETTEEKQRRLQKKREYTRKCRLMVSAEKTEQHKSPPEYSHKFQTRAAVKVRTEKYLKAIDTFRDCLYEVCMH